MDQVTRKHPGRRGLAALGLAIALGTALPTAALADPLGGSNSTPGTLTCPSLNLTVDTTSGSPAARAVQVVGTSDVFIFRGAPDWDFYQGQGTASKWISCVLYEPGPGGVGTLSGVGYFSH
ncbi:MAG TPA: hypothetical protein VF484_07720 [Candidatus Limnocylindrales bacterium]